MERLVLIANPAASHFTGGAHRDVMGILSRSFEVEAIWPQTVSEARAAAADAAASNARMVVAMGGDGIVHHVAQGLVDTSSALAILPTGTTNVIARLLDIPSRAGRAARLVVDRHELARLGTARLELHRGDTVTLHHAMFACGFGIDAEVVAEADKEPYRKYRFGALHYARVALSVAALRFPARRPHVTVTSGSRTARATGVLLQFRDIYTYFGRLALRLDPSIPDPMTALIVERLRRRRIPALGVRVLTNRPLGELAGFETWRSVEALELIADPPIAAQADGESLGLVDSGRVTWHPEAIAVVVPPGFAR